MSYLAKNFLFLIVPIIFLLNIECLESKDLRAQLYNTWHTAIALNSTPLHDKKSHFPYSNIHAKKGGTLRQYALGGFDSLDFYMLKGMKAGALELIYDTLMAQSLDEPFSLYALVADRVSIANDNSGVRFHINKLAKFNDGTHIKADDIKYSFDSIITKGAPNYARYYNDVKEARVIDDGTIEFIFKNKNNLELPFILAQIMVMPKHFYVKNNIDSFGTDPLRVPLGSGPYTILSFDVNKQITYIKNKNYWGRDLMVNRGLYNFEKIIVDYYKDDNVALRAFLSGAYDFRIESSAKNWAQGYESVALKDHKFKMLEIGHSLPVGMQGFFLNTRNKFLNNIIIREAINYAFDFEWSNKYLFFSQYKRTSSYYQNSIFASYGALDSKNDEYKKDKYKIEEKKIFEELKNLNCKKSQKKDCIKTQLDSHIFTDIFKNPNTLESSKRANLLKAQELLHKAGFKIINNTTLVDKNNDKVEFTLLLNSNLFERVVLPFKENLKRLGINLNIRIMPQAQYENLVRNFNYDMIVGLVPQSLSPGNEQSFYFSSSSANLKGSLNYSGIKDENVDYLIALFNETKDEVRRVAILRAIDRILLWGYYVVPHYYAQNFRLALQSYIKTPAIFPKYGINPYLWEHE